LGPDYGDVSRIVSGGFLLFVRMFMLLIHYDDSQRLHRGEYGGPGSDHNPRISSANLMPFIMTLTG
jgi:hypothetical protein